MRSLFWKIFLWFWFAMLVLGGAIVWTTAHIGSNERPPLVERALRQFNDETGKAQQVFRDQGLTGLRAWLEKSHPRHTQIYLLDPLGRDMLGKPVPLHIRRLAMMGGSPEDFWRQFNEQSGQRRGWRHWFGDEQGPTDWEGRRHIVSEQIFVPGRGVFSLVAAFVPPHPVWHLFTVPRLVIVLLVSGLVCWVMARYLTAPLARLSSTARSFAEGELEVRVGSSITRRGDEIGELGRDFDDMAHRVQSLLEAQQRLLRDVSHELRSPLARLQAALGLARQRNHENVGTELDRIEREADRLNDMIGQILTLTKLTGANELPKELVRLDEMVTEIVDDASFEAQQQHKRIDLVESEALSLTGNPSLLHSAFENIVRNALRHTGRDTAVEIALRADNATAVFTVRDHGRGIDENKLSRIFDAFYRVEDARDRVTGGHGLGLAIAKRAVDLHDGSIVAGNVEGGGLKIEIRLPRVVREGRRHGAVLPA